MLGQRRDRLPERKAVPEEPETTRTVKHCNSVARCARPIAALPLVIWPSYACGAVRLRHSSTSERAVMASRHQLIGAEVSYYTGKVRAYLRYKDIPFEEVLATRETYRDVILPRTGVAF